MIRFERTAVPVPPFAAPGPPATWLDADVDRAGEVVLVTRNENGSTVYFPHRDTTCHLASETRYPGIRWMGASRALLFGARRDEHQPNAWIVDDRGTATTGFALGDAIADVLANDARIVVTYFDEGVFGGDRLSRNGLATFSPSGDFLWGWNSGRLADRLYLYDCYAAGFADDDKTLGLFLYSSHRREPGHVFAMLDIERRTVVLHDVPRTLLRTRTLSFADAGICLFAVGPHGREHVVAWRPGDDAYEAVRSPAPLTRGLGGGRFLSVTGGAVEIVTVTVQNADER